MRRDRDKQAALRNFGFLKNAENRAVPLDAEDIVNRSELIETFEVGIDDDDVVIFPGQDFAELLSDLAAAGDDDFHGDPLSYRNPALNDWNGQSYRGSLA